MIRSAQKLTVEQVLPGHGPTGGKELLEGQAQFMTELYKNVQAAVNSGKKLEEIQTSIKLPDNVKNWSGKDLKTQVKDTFEEITQKKPHGDLPH